MYILGISAFFHDAAACLVRDGEIVAAAQEERFTRKKHDPGLPLQALRACLKQAGIDFDAVDAVAFYEKPHLKLERILQNYANFYPQGFDTFQHAIPVWWKQKFWLPSLLRSALVALSPSQGRKMAWDGRLVFPEHHLSHAASAYFPSPFREAAILTIDGVGEWATTTLALGQPDARSIPRIRFLNEIRYPDSLGMLYSAFTYYLGFKVNSGEYKVMGLAPYGAPKYVPLILEHLIDLREDGSFRLNMDYFRFPYDPIMIHDRLADVFGLPPRQREARLQEKHFDIAASIQRVLELAVSRMANHLHRLTKLPNLCLAGGVALNCVANGLLLREGPFHDLWIQPAAGDAGGAVGAALYVWHELLNQRKVPPPSAGRDLMQGSFLGPQFTNDEVKQALQRRNLKFQEYEPARLAEVVAECLCREMVVGWFQGRMEFGPRALGARSILGDPRSSQMQSVMNLKIKFRESFRPFAPSVLREHVADWFDLNGREQALLGSSQGGYDSPYMLLVAPVRNDKRHPVSSDQAKLTGLEQLKAPRSVIPACTHVDYSARIHTVTEAENPRFYQLLRAFQARTGVPVLVNTSFNVRGEPIVCTPDDAISCFLGTSMDALVLENCVALKSDVPPALRVDYKDRFEPD
jgi:carbamoyltransferase